MLSIHYFSGYGSHENRQDYQNRKKIVANMQKEVTVEQKVSTTRSLLQRKWKS